MTRLLRPLRLLVASDLTAGGQAALDRALLLARAPGTRVRVVHALPPDLPWQLLRAVDAAARRRLRAALRGRRATIIVRSGRARDVIVGEAAAWRADLLVLGTRGRRGWARLAPGETAIGVVRQSAPPVLVVRRPPRSVYQRPLVAWAPDGSTDRALDLARRLCDPDTATLLQCVDLPFPPELARFDAARDLAMARRDALARARAEATVLARAIGTPWRAVARLADPRRGIPAEAARRRTDLIVVGTHARRGVARAMLGSVAEAVIRSARSDVLVARPARGRPPRSPRS